MEKNIELSSKEISGIVGLFFKRIVYHMKHGDYIYIQELGYFGMTADERKLRIKRDNKIFAERVRKKRITNLKKISKYQKKLDKTQIINDYNEKVKKRWEDFNNIRKGKGLSAWTLRDWQKITKDYFMTKYCSVPTMENVVRTHSKPRKDPAQKAIAERRKWTKFQMKRKMKQK